MEPVRIAILDLYNRHQNQGMQGILRIIQDLNFPSYLEVFDVRAEGKLPGLDFDVYISSGGPGCPISDGEEWDTRWKNLMSAILDHNRTSAEKKFVFLICHSFQMLSHLLKVGTITERHKRSFGIYTIHKTTDGKSEPLLRHLPDPFYAADSRGWQLVNPDPAVLKELGAKVICLEKERPDSEHERATMGIRFTNEVIGFQFHPEADQEGMRRFLRNPARKKRIIQVRGNEKYLAMFEILQDPETIQLTCNTILPGFLQYALTKLRSETVEV